MRTSFLRGFAVIAVIAFAANFIYAHAARPAQTPPAGNVSTPIHIGGAAQTKAGLIDSDTGLSTGGSLAVGGNASVAGTLAAGGLQVIKSAHAPGSNNYHLELYSPNTGSGNNEVSLRFHQGNQYWAQIRYRAGGFRFTQGNSDSLTRVTVGELCIQSTCSSSLPAGPQGPAGPTGPMPQHQWSGSSLRFQTPNGWGNWVDLRGATGSKGDKGDPGKDGKNGTNGSTGPMPQHQWSGSSLRFQTPNGWGNWVDLRGATGSKGDKGDPGASPFSLSSGRAVFDGDVVLPLGRSIWIDNDTIGSGQRLRMHATAYNAYIDYSSALYLRSNGDSNDVILDSSTMDVNNINLEVENSFSNNHAIQAIARGTGSAGVRGSGVGYDFLATGPGTNYAAASSKRWKENVETLSGALGKVLSIRGVAFDWDDDHGGKRDIGFIAEEIGEIVPEVVQYADPKDEAHWYTAEDGTRKLYAEGVDYGALTPVLVEAIKEQQVLIEELQAELCAVDDDRPWGCE